MMMKRLARFAGLLLAVALCAAPRNSTPASQAKDTERVRAAALAGLEVAEFRRACDNNSHLHLDKSGRPLFCCENAPSAGQVGPDTTPYTSTASYPLDQTFKLHTRPGAAKVI
jgi:hypothetical protein